MAVKVGSARSDENGQAHGGKAGDQKNGKEVSTQDWYKHSKGWRVLRAKDPEIAEKIAKAMQAACDNPHIGYDQWQRDTLRTQAAKVIPAYWPGVDKVVVDTETDCSALVRVCIAYAVGRDVIGEVIGESRWSTANQAKFMLKTGLFVEMEGSKYTDKSDYLKRGDVLVTCTQGHTVVVLSDGSKAHDDDPTPPTDPHPLLKKGDKGEAVVEMQKYLLTWNENCLPKYGADGDFGSETDKAIREFQKENKLVVDGECGNKTWAKLEEVAKPEPKKQVRVTGNSVNLRIGAGTGHTIIGVAHKDDVLEYTDTAPVGKTIWYNTTRGWISGVYTVVI